MQVTNSSPTQHIDAGKLAEIITVILNRKARGSGIAAYEDGQSKPNDAILRISILRESAIPRRVPLRPGVSTWRITIALDATLTAADGMVVWRKTNAEYKSDYSNNHPGADAPWGEPGFRRWAYFKVYRPLIGQMWHGN